MPERPSPSQLQEQLRAFVRYRQEHLRGDEKGEAQVFLDRFFRALGHNGAFEAGATLEFRVARRSEGGTAFADLVWKPRVLIEMKKVGQDLTRHYRQAFEYWINLVPDRPAYVILCNFDEFWIYDLNNQLEEPVDRVNLANLADRWESLAFLLPEPEEPVFLNDLVEVTRDAAAQVSGVFNRLIGRGVERDSAQRFILQCVMAMFAEDIGLLPRHMFTQVLRDCLEGESAYDLIFGLFREMNTLGETPAGRFTGTPYFNGGLFAEVVGFNLESDEVEDLARASHYDWKAVRPAIFGTLFEQSVEKEARHAYGAHFTSEADIQKIVLPSIVRPWRERIEVASTVAELSALEDEMLAYRVLDPACGCGNFLYVAYRELRRLEVALAEKLAARRRRPGAGAERRLSFVSAKQFFGIDINEFATEIAKVTLMLARKLAANELGDERTVLPLDDLDENFIAGDALRRNWPRFDACIGNPPYLGRRRIIEERGAPYASWLAQEFPDVGGVSDYVVYWFRKTHDLLPENGRAGLVGTNTIRQGASRRASLDYIIDRGGVIFEAVSSQPWSGDAAVSVSIVNWAKQEVSPKTLWLANGSVKLEMQTIPGSLSPEVDLRSARNLNVNTETKTCFQGQTPGHSGFVITPSEARDLITRDALSASVIHPYIIGDELIHTSQPSRCIIDIPADDAVKAKAQAPAAFERLRTAVLPQRRRRAEEEATRNAETLKQNARANVNWHHRRFLEFWWQLSYRRARMLEVIEELPRYIALSRVASENRLPIYVYVSPAIRPGDALAVFALADDYSFGILQSRLHHLWFIERCSTLEARPRYTATTVYDSFPWPQAPIQEHVDRVVSAVAQLWNYRDGRLSEGISLGDQYDVLREPGRSPLRDLHEELDAAVFELYGFDPTEDSLAQLLALNQSISEEERSGTTKPRGPGDQGLAGTTRTSTKVVLGATLIF